MAKRTIKSPVETFSGLVAGVQFVDGVGSTDNEGAIAYFERQGYDVAGEKPTEPDFPLGDPNEEWTEKQLRAYAAAHQKDLGKAKGKQAVWAAIQPGGTPYKGVTEPDGTAIVHDSVTDGADIKQDSLPENLK